MNAFNVNQWAFQIVSDDIRDNSGEARSLDHYDMFCDGENFFRSVQREPESLLCTIEELQAAINAANIEQEAWVSFGDLSPEEKIDVVNQAIEAGLVEETEDGYYEDIDDEIIILCAEGGGFTVEKREHNQY